MPSTAQARALAQRLFDALQQRGAVAVETDILQPAETLLDLYGEDIRARAYVTGDPVSGEMMLRPDFTVPVVLMQMRDGAEPARYTYMGDVFRKQSAGSGRPAQYLQVGYEVFDGSDPERADAEVFACLCDVLKPLQIRAVTGDIGVLMAAVGGLSTSEHRRAALLRHIWRPGRFRTLLDRFSGQAEPLAHREQLLASLNDGGAETRLAEAGPQIGMRERSEVLARVSLLQADANEADLPKSETDALMALLSLNAPARNALGRLHDIAADLPAISVALGRFEARLGALDALGVDVDCLSFEGSYGRMSMEYYDGFVFGLYAAAQPELPPLATGGRYDALTRVLGQGRSIPAVGGVIRPELVSAARQDR